MINSTAPKDQADEGGVCGGLSARGSQQRTCEPGYISEKQNLSVARNIVTRDATGTRKFNRKQARGRGCFLMAWLSSKKKKKKGKASLPATRKGSLQYRGC